ncbi:MAG TPA: preprotein translocase subunit SecE [Solirubrobacteraceae bacterium]|nr:preprotein translocase subunit SecE [Solirubrobacteraceae bacterium]
MARDRKRAKQRQQRRSKAGTLPPPADTRGETRHQTHHENVPGSLEHASGEVEEFDAALIAGSHLGDLDEMGDGRRGGDGSGPPETTDRVAAAETAIPGAAERAEPDEPEDFDESEEAEEADDREPEADAAGGGGGGLPARPVARGSAPTPARGARADGENRVLSFLRASWAELQRVQWPDRRQVAQATAVVLGFVAIAGVYLGVADWVAGKIVNAIL